MFAQFYLLCVVVITNAIKFAYSYCTLSSNLFIISIFNLLFIRNAIVIENFLRSDSNAIVRLIFFTLIFVRDLKA